MTKKTDTIKQKTKQTVYLNRKGYPNTIDLVSQEAQKEGSKSLSNMASRLIQEAVDARHKTA
jgi:hypothetical protein